MTFFGNDTSLIISFMLLVGIISAFGNNLSHNMTIMTSGIGIFLGSIVSFIVSIISIYYLQGGLYAIMTMQVAIVYIIMYTIIGGIGASLGYYFRDEILNK